MKKILFVVMMMALASAAFAKQVVLDVGDYFLIADDNYSVLPMDSFSDGRKVEFLRECMPTEIAGKKVKYDAYIIDKVDKFAEKYNRYFLIRDDETYMSVGHNLGDGRMILIGYYLVEK